MNPIDTWLAHLQNPNTRRAYASALADFTAFHNTTTPTPDLLTPTTLIAWRDHLQTRKLSPASRRARLAALSSLCTYLQHLTLLPHNPTRALQRPRYHPLLHTPALSNTQARQLLNAPHGPSLKATRDRALLATLLYHGLRRHELCQLTVADFTYERRSLRTLPILGKGDKRRYIPLHPATIPLIHDYLLLAGHSHDSTGALFRALPPAKKPSLSPDAVWRIVKHYSSSLGFPIAPHSLRTTAATNALEHHADIALVQDWLGHAHIATTRLYDRRHVPPEQSPTFKIIY